MLGVKGDSEVTISPICTGNVIQRSDHDQCSNPRFLPGGIRPGLVNTNIAVVALWHRNGPISTTETRANRCPTGRERLLLPEAWRAAGIGAAQDRLQDLQAPHRPKPRQRGNHQGTPSAHPDFARNSQTRAVHIASPFDVMAPRSAPQSARRGHFITHYQQVDDSVPPPSAPDSGPVNPSHCLPREQPVDANRGDIPAVGTGVPLVRQLPRRAGLRPCSGRTTPP